METKKMYNRFYSILFYSILSLTILISSCSEDENIPTVAKKFDYPKGKNILWNNLNVWHSNNPYDSIGYYHNQGMDYFIQNVESLTSNNLEADICEIVADYCATIGMDSTEIAEGYLVSINLLQSQFDLSTFIGSISSNTHVQELAYELIFDITRDGIIVDSLSCDEIIDNIKDWEILVLNYLDLTSEEQELLLKAGSIARFSLSYWNEVISDPYNVWNQKAGSFQILTTSMSDEQKIAASVVADIIGLLAPGGSVMTSITATAAMAVYCWFDEICNGIGSFFEAIWPW